jgi:ABC-type multidrug transport system ATPase subunit
VTESLEAALRRGRLAYCRGKRFEERVEEVLKLVGLGERGENEAGKLSHGEQRLLELGLVLSLEPRLLLLDEPTGGLNPAERERLAQQICILEGGRIVRAGQAEGLEREELEQHLGI